MIVEKVNYRYILYSLSRNKDFHHPVANPFPYIQELIPAIRSYSSCRVSLAMPFIFPFLTAGYPLLSGLDMGSEPR
ncbi:hypothetical protein, partial [Chryseobacterium sp.]|uniref:hypothetical protein n=1 Tax=Chryseobacterium sp. TaxID=1871047 RepID=UPI0025C1FFBE